MTKTSDLALLSLAELSRLVRDRRVSPVEITQTYIDRIAALDGRLHSVNHVRTEEALAEALFVERAIARGGWRGPLHGMPIAFKDLIDVAGVPTTAQAAHRRTNVPTADAGVVTALR